MCRQHFPRGQGGPNVAIAGVFLGIGAAMATTYADAHDPSALDAEVVEQLDQHVRELVRREGVDPQRDAPLVRRIAETVVRDHDERSLTGAVTRVADEESLVGELVARVSRSEEHTSELQS